MQNDVVKELGTNFNKFDTSQIGNYLVTKQGIEQLIDIDGKGGYTTKKLIDKKAFILAYQEFILKTDNNNMREPGQ